MLANTAVTVSHGVSASVANLVALGTAVMLDTDTVKIPTGLCVPWLREALAAYGSMRAISASARVSRRKGLGDQNEWNADTAADVGVEKMMGRANTEPMLLRFIKEK